MTEKIIIILLVIALIYYYRQSKTQTNFTDKSGGTELNQTNSSLTSFLKDNLNSNSLEEIKTKLGGKTLDELLEENEDYETEVDTLTRTKNSLEQDLLAQSNAFQNRLREKDRETKKLKEDLGNLEKRFQKCQGDLSSEKQISKGSVERISKLTEQITNLEKENQKLKIELKKMPGEFPPEDKK